MKLDGKSILIISPESWGINYVSKHHYALELSKNNQVYFLNPPSSDNRIQKVNEKLIVIDYRPVIRGINRLPAILRNYLNTLDIRKLEKRCEIKSFDIIWSFDPFRFQNLKLFHSQLSIYHAVDVHNATLEKEISSTAHIVFATCEIIRVKILPDNPNVFNIGHGVSEHFFKGEREIKRNPDKPKVCMMGNLLRKIDFTALFSLIENHRDLEFHFIGPHTPSNLSNSEDNVTEIKHLKSFSNTHLHGSVPQEVLPTLLSGMDVFLILYRKDENPATLANPHKVLEYLATGKTILSYKLATNLNTKNLMQFTSRHDLEKDFNTILENIKVYNDEKKEKLRKQIAAAHTYRKKIAEVEKKVNETLFS